MLEPEELAGFLAAFGVAEPQVRRDHLISHLLAALGALDLPVTFFGGTALARTHLADPEAGARLSEDIDLYGPDRPGVAAVLGDRLPRLLRREFPGSGWDPPLAAVRAVDAGQYVSGAGLRVRVQLLDSLGDHHDLANYPTEIRAVDLRYRDTPGTALLRVPTLASFAAMKTAAWIDRRAARDLYDLAGLARIGALTAEAATLVRQVTGLSVTPRVLGPLPVLDWTVQLAHQTASLSSAQECFEEVRTAYATALRWPAEDPFAE
ncbi:MAG: hypothetical protein AUI14_15825 [Actinobacteria bacterium 13_2_20CM_2_71_6]|nr:MAG: hypothetical protein AUI14_15825 [Actinobacteria bacterium 13_2_20CM_2_71_6]